MSPRATRSLSRFVAVLGAVGLAASITACAPPGPDATPTASPSKAAPVFATDEEAFAAAEEAYGRYIEVQNAITNAGGEGVEALDRVAFGEALKDGQASAQKFLERKAHTTGALTYTVHKRVQYFEDPDRGAIVQLAICEHYGDVDVLDEAGNSLVVDGRDEDLPSGVTLEGREADGLKVSKQWEYGDFC